jgi:hypothetical protein
VNYASGLIYSSVPQALAGLFGLLAAVLALSSESVANSYGPSPARILADDPQTRLLAIGYVATIVLSLLGLLTHRSLASQTWDEWCLLVATAWLLGQTLGFVSRVIRMLRASGLTKEILARLRRTHLSYEVPFNPVTRRPELFVLAHQILVRAAEAGEAEEVAQCLSEISTRLVDLLWRLDDQKFIKAVQYLRWRLAELPRPKGATTEWALDSGLGALLRALRFSKPRTDRGALFQVFAFSVELSRNMSDMGLKPQFVRQAACLCGAALLRVDPTAAVKLSRCCDLLGADGLPRMPSWLGKEEKSKLSELQAALSEDRKAMALGPKGA